MNKDKKPKASMKDLPPPIFHGDGLDLGPYKPKKKPENYDWSSPIVMKGWGYDEK